MHFAPTLGMTSVLTPALGRGDLPEDVLQDAAVAVVLHLVRRVDADRRVERRRFSAGCFGFDLDCLARLEIRETANRERLFAGEAERFACRAVHELKRKNSHSDQVAAVDFLE